MDPPRAASPASPRRDLLPAALVQRAPRRRAPARRPRRPPRPPRSPRRRPPRCATSRDELEIWRSAAGRVVRVEGQKTAAEGEKKGRQGKQKRGPAGNLGLASPLTETAQSGFGQQKKTVIPILAGDVLHGFQANCLRSQATGMLGKCLPTKVPLM